MYIKEKGVWDHIDGTLTRSTEKTALEAWQTKDAQIIFWILASIEPHMVNNLSSYSTAKGVWDYLKHIYNQNITAKRFQLELDITNYHQRNLLIQDYYSGFLNLWVKYSTILYGDLYGASLTLVKIVYEVNKRDQFLMKHQPKFKVVRTGLLNRFSPPSLDVCLGELLREE